ncbi:auxin response factor 11-like [Cynara cardunculus var. scolymus]|uniref:Auxin response factor n=1 Tax=Cynara cardunculus var. scolymus TaxID=59895 RepID=A0A103XE68_CYNCS|nr:auxin response factor 11-like [Cynara cardunculus var. scolymus]KVH89009.1 Auxin response factor [Cynara cardunculus var. scolymus]
MGSSHIGSNDEVQKELFMACAGPFVNVPVQGERVFYFPQGHIEQFQEEDSANQKLIRQQFSKLDLPNKMLCRVVDSSLKVDHETDEVYAIIKLCPSQEDYSQPQPTQELIAKDFHGRAWSFTHVYRGRPRRHVITHGWKKFVRQKGLVAGDALIFARGPNNELRIGIRRLVQRIPVILSNESQIQVLASTSQALYKNKEFVVYYNPRAFPFLVGLQKYLKADAYNFSSGMNVIMRLKGGKNAENEKRGVIVEQTTISAEWPTSEWRSIKVQWNIPSRRSLIQMPERVSAWQLEPVLEDVRSHVGEASSSRNTRLQICDDGPTYCANAIWNESLHSIPSSSVGLSDKGKECKKPKVLRLFGVDISVTTSCSTSETN